MENKKYSFYTKLVSSANIVLAIQYAINDDHDHFLVNYRKLNLSNNTEVINKIKRVRSILIKLLNCDFYLKAKLFLKPKGITETGKIEYRPIVLFDNEDYLIAQYAILNILVLDIDFTTGKLKKNRISELIDHTIFGNNISTSSSSLFPHWKKQYSKYSSQYYDNYEYYKQHYKYEINIDLKQFYLSLSPYFLCNYLIELYKSYGYTDYDVLIEKSLAVKLKKFENNNNLYNEYCISIDNGYYCKGLPQGLPQSKVFSNLVIKIINEQYCTLLNAEVLSYVDDAIIFTNCKLFNNENNSDTEINYLQSIINVVNEKLKKINKMTNNVILNKIYDKKYVFEISINKKKYNKIDLEKDEKHDSVIRMLAHKTSATSSLLFNCLMEENKYSIFSHCYFYFNLINKQLSDYNDSINENNDNNGVVKKLERYKKFYKNRAYSLLVETDKSEFIGFVNNEIFLMKSKNTSELIDYINDECIIVLINLLKNNLSPKENAQYLNRIRKIFENNGLMDTNYYKLLFETKILYYDKNEAYLELKKKLSFFAYSNKKEIDKKVLEILSTNIDQSNFISFANLIKCIFEKKRTKEISKYRLIIENNKIYIRMLLNMIFSVLFNVDYSISIPTTNFKGFLLPVYQFKILYYIRNRNFTLGKDIYLLKKVYYLRDKYDSIIDESLLEAIPFFNKNISSIEKIDTLINTHLYVKNIWMNGTKYLYFYTSHNQIHSVELIKNTDRLKNNIELFNFNSEEYYYLYLSCYLHDIAMVLDNNNIKKDFNYLIECIERLKEILKEVNCVKTNVAAANILFEYFNKIDSAIERNIRSNHGVRSGEYINNDNKIGLTLTEKYIVSNISVAHTIDCSRIYSKKEIDNKINIQLIKICLRLADCFDMSKNRVSTEFLDMLDDVMPIESQFHYVSHLLTNNFKIYKRYYDSESGKNYFDPNRYYEEIYFIIDINNFIYENVNSCAIYKEETKNQFEVCEKSLEIKNQFDKKLLIYDSKEKGLLLDIKKNIGGCKKCEKCTLMCSWLGKKNEYLINELFYLQYYINNTIFNDNIFKTQQVKFYVYYSTDNQTSNDRIKEKIRKIHNKLEKK